MGRHGRAEPEGKGTFIVQDPYERTSLWMHLRFSVFWRIWPSMLAFTLVAVLVVLVDRLRDDVNLAVNPQMLSVLGTILGFVISSRISSAYERYIEGRRLWQSIQTGTRMMSRLIWMHCPNSRGPEVPTEMKEADAAKALLEKKTMLNLLEAFAVSVKHYLRGETGIHYEDLYHLVLFLPKYQFPNSTPIRRSDVGDRGNMAGSTLGRSGYSTLATVTPALELDNDDKKQLQSKMESADRVRFRGKARADTQDTKASGSTSSSQKPAFGPRSPDSKLLPAHNPPAFNLIDDVLPILAPIRSIFKFGRRTIVNLLDDGADKKRKRKHKKDIYSGQNIPMEIILHISSYISAQQRRKNEATTVSAMLAANAMLSEALSGLERVLTTPIPFGYSIHLKHTAWLYLTFLPFQLVGQLGYLTIPAQMIACFCFLGFLEIGDMIEQPLGYDADDLDMGMFCDAIRKELKELSSSPPNDPTDFFFCDFNEPLAPEDIRSTAQLVEDGATVDDIVDALAKGHDHSDGLNRSFTEAQSAKTRSKEHTAVDIQYLPAIKREFVEPTEA